MSFVNVNEMEDIMIEIQKMSINEIKNVNLIGHVGGPSRIKDEFPKTFGKKKTKCKPKSQKSNFKP